MVQVKESLMLGLVEGGVGLDNLGLPCQQKSLHQIPGFSTTVEPQCVEEDSRDRQNLN